MSFVLGNVEILLVTDPWYVAKEIIDIGAAVASAAAQLYIENKYIDLTDNYKKLYTNNWDFYNQQFQIGGEAPLVNQVFNNPLAGNGEPGTVYSPKYAFQWSNINFFRGNGAFSRFWWLDRANMYNDRPLNYGCDPRGFPVAVGEPFDLDNFATVDDADSYLYRYEEHLKDIYDERTWEWQNQALNLGVKQANVVESGIATSFRYIDEASTNVADWFATQANGLAKYSSYRHSEASTGAMLRRSARVGTSMATGSITTPGVDLLDNGASTAALS